MFTQLMRMVVCSDRCILLGSVLALALGSGCTSSQRYEKGLDPSHLSPQEEFRVFQIRIRDATEAAMILDNLFNAEPVAADLPKDSSSSPSRHKIRVVVDGKANTLFVLANADVMQKAEEILGKLDNINDGPPQAPELSIYRLRHAKAAPAAALLMSVFKFDDLPIPQPSNLEAVHDPWYFNAVAYEGTNSVVIAASHTVMHKATELLEELDRSSDPNYHPQTQPTEPPTTIKFDLRRADE